MNPLGMRLTMAAFITLATFAGVLAFAYMKFPENAVVIGLAVAAIVGIVIFVDRKEKAARFKVYFATVQEFGAPVNFGKTESAFERDGTRFDIEYPQGKNHAYYKLTFFLNDINEKFSVQNKTLIPKFHADCRRVENSTLPPEYIVQSRNPDFVLKLLENRRIRDEILNYNASFWSGISITFEDGSFEMIWTPPISEQVEGFNQICRSSVVFHDELKKIAQTKNAEV